MLSTIKIYIIDNYPRAPKLVLYFPNMMIIQPLSDHHNQHACFKKSLKKMDRKTFMEEKTILLIKRCNKFI